MPISALRGGRVPIELWSPLEEVESAALDQLRNTARLPWVFHHVAVMADVHYGKGATVGSVVAMKGAVAPAAVGVDIGCGMGAVRTSLTASQLPESLRELRSVLEATIPVGPTSHDRQPFRTDITLRTDADALMAEYVNLDTRVQDIEGRARLQIGTLGGGNHFIEVCVDEEQRVWLTLHSGSRNIGKTLAEIHIAIAQDLVHNDHLPDKDLAVFLSGTPEMQAYRRDLFWAQRYAALNRRVMLWLLQQVFERVLGLVRLKTIKYDAPILCHHNYVSEERHYDEDVLVTRKGAISARQGELGMIPGSMGTSSFIVEGLGNPLSFHSASHGAGRRMSRGAAKRTFKVEDLIAQTAGVECRKDSGVLDELPAAYKDIHAVMQNQQDLVRIVHELKPLMSVKG